MRLSAGKVRPYLTLVEFLAQGQEFGDLAGCRFLDLFDILFLFADADFILLALLFAAGPFGF